MGLWIMLRAFLLAIVTVPLRRWRHGARRPSWTIQYEVFVAAVERGFAAIWRHDYVTQRRYSRELARPSALWKMVRFTDVTIAGLNAEWCETVGLASTTQVYLYFHGGGFNGGSTLTHRDSIALQTLAIGRRTLAVNYRLAPEHVFPAQLDDTCAVYRWLLDHGTLPEQIILGGDSAGGNLVITTMLRLRDQGVPLPRAGVCLCPWLDLTDRAGTPDVADWIAPADWAEWGNTYLGQTVTGPTARDPLVSPVFADLSGLPPLLIQVGTSEFLLAQVRRFVAAAKAAGVHTSYHEYPDMVHNWHAFGSRFSQSAAAIAQIGEFCRGFSSVTINDSCRVQPARRVRVD